MSGITVETVLPAPPAEVWARLEDVRTHVDWMHDAEAIEVTSEHDQGVGVTFDCLTVVGPIRLTDRMRITEWDPPSVMGVDHTGAVSGSGRFVITALGASSSRFVWTEELTFPWFLGGPIGAWLARPVLSLIWRRNLAELRSLFT
jgi:hypothetical protein